MDTLDSIYLNTPASESDLAKLEEYKTLLAPDYWSNERFAAWVIEETGHELPITVQVDYVEKSEDSFESSLTFLREGETLFTLKDLISTYTPTDLHQKVEYVNYFEGTQRSFSQVIR